MIHKLKKVITPCFSCRYRDHDAPTGCSWQIRRHVAPIMFGCGKYKKTWRDAEYPAWREWV